MATENKGRYIGFEGRKNLVVSANSLTASTSTTKWIYVDALDKIPTPNVMKYPLAEITLEQIKELRKTDIPSFLLKEDGKYYFAKIPKQLNFTSSNLMGMHCCANSLNTCHHLSAASDEDGGCAKVRGFSRGIERYPWITMGYETFNVCHGCFVVLKCNHFEVAPPRKPVTIKEKNEAKLLLAQFVWDDVDNLTQVRQRIEKNFNRLHNIAQK